MNINFTNDPSHHTSLLHKQLRKLLCMKDCHFFLFRPLEQMICDFKIDIYFGFLNYFHYSVANLFLYSFIEMYMNLEEYLYYSLFLMMIHSVYFRLNIIELYIYKSCCNAPLHIFTCHSLISIPCKTFKIFSQSK